MNEHPDLTDLLTWLAEDHEGRVAEVQITAEREWGPSDEDEGIVPTFIVDLFAAEYGVGGEHAHGSYKVFAEGETIEQAAHRAIEAMTALLPTDGATS